MTETTNPAHDIAALEQQLAQARADAEQQARDVARDYEARELAFRRQRLARYDAQADARAVREAERALSVAITADPVFGALIDRHAAVWRQHRARRDAFDDAVAIARADGTNVPHDPGTNDPPNLIREHLWRAIENAATDRLEQWREQVDGAFAAATFGTTDPDLIAQVELELEAARRRKAAANLDQSTDVTGMTEADRKAAGLPPSRPE